MRGCGEVLNPLRLQPVRVYPSDLWIHGSLEERALLHELNAQGVCVVEGVDGLVVELED